ncbi:hypothetical protein IJ531_03210 [bacterium]|nr:hypothetical protein [bacterium]
METLFDDKFINNKVLEHLIKEVKREQITKTIENIDYFFELRKKLNSKYDFTPAQNEEIEFLKQFNNARKNLQA